MPEHPDIRIDVSNMMAPHLPGGTERAAFEGGMADRFGRAFDEVALRRKRGEMGFFDLPYASETVDQVEGLANGFGQWFEDVVVLGIGGSGLGSLTLRDALCGPLWNERSDEKRDHFPRLRIIDNPDPDTVRALLDHLDPARTLFNVVSKSGSTAETMAQYLATRDWVERGLGEDEARGHFLFTTDPGRGALRQIAESEGIPTLSVPENVGGRFSVLSSVGLFPAAACGVDVRALLAGAAAMEARCRSRKLVDNPAGVLAALLHAAHTESGRSVHVFMPYADRLRSLALWFQQLWAESLGKEGGGPTPLASVGATDQHSLLQLLMEGPRDKVVLFAGIEREDDVDIPERHPEMPGLAYLGGHGLGELLDVERAATAEALRREGRANLSIQLPGVTPHALGQSLMLLQIATVYAGGLYGVDPLDQPGVELGKTLTYGLMGRDGFEAPELDAGDPRWRF